MKTILVTPPSSPDGYVITLTAAKLQCRVDGDDEDSLITSFIAAAQAEVENILGRALTTQVWRLPLDTFPSGTTPIMVPRPPLASISSLTYYDSDNVQQSLTSDDYVLDSDAAPALIYPSSTGWPSTYTDAHPAVAVTFTCGESDTDLVDENIKQIVRLLVGRSYENREAMVTGTIAVEFRHVYRYLFGHAYRDRTDYSGQE